MNLIIVEEKNRDGATGPACCGDQEKESHMLMTVLLVVVILALLGALPTWPHSRSWGYYPSGGLGLVVIILILLLLMNRV